MPSTQINIPCNLFVEYGAEYLINSAIIVQNSADMFIPSGIFLAELNEYGIPIVPPTYEIVENTHELLNYSLIPTIGLPPWMEGVKSPVSNLERFVSAFQVVINDYQQDVLQYVNGMFVNTVTDYQDLIGVVLGSFTGKPAVYDTLGNQITFVDSLSSLFDNKSINLKTLDRYYIMSDRMIIRFAMGFKNRVIINGVGYNVDVIKLHDNLDSWGYEFDLPRHEGESDNAYRNRLNYEFGDVVIDDKTYKRYATSTDLGLAGQIARFASIPIELIDIKSIVDYTNEYLDDYGVPDTKIVEALRGKNSWGNFIYNRIAWMTDSELGSTLLLIHRAADKYD